MFERMSAGGACTQAASAEGEREARSAGEGGAASARPETHIRAATAQNNGVSTMTAVTLMEECWPCMNALVYLVWTSIRLSAFSNCSSSNMHMHIAKY